MRTVLVNAAKYMMSIIWYSSTVLVHHRIASLGTKISGRRISMQHSVLEWMATIIFCLYGWTQILRFFVNLP
jgi:hypothetical protein